MVSGWSMNGQMNEWTDGWMDKLTDGWMDGSLVSIRILNPASGW